MCDMIDVLRSDLRTMMGSVSVCVTFPFFSTFCCVLNSYHHHAINIAALGFPGVKSGTVQSHRSGVCTFLSTLRCCGFLGPLALDQNSEKHGKTHGKTMWLGALPHVGYTKCEAKAAQLSMSRKDLRHTMSCCNQVGSASHHINTFLSGDNSNCHDPFRVEAVALAPDCGSNLRQSEVKTTGIDSAWNPAIDDL